LLLLFLALAAGFSWVIDLNLAPSQSQVVVAGQLQQRQYHFLAECLIWLSSKRSAHCPMPNGI